jgi:hypothetical protein
MRNADLFALCDSGILPIYGNPSIEITTSGGQFRMDKSVCYCRIPTVVGFSKKLSVLAESMR